MTSLEHDFLFDLTQKIVQTAISTSKFCLVWFLKNKNRKCEMKRFFVFSSGLAIGISLICAVIENFFESFSRNLCQLRRFECASIHRTLEQN